MCQSTVLSDMESSFILCKNIRSNETAMFMNIYNVIPHPALRDSISLHALHKIKTAQAECKEDSSFPGNCLKDPRARTS